MLKRIGAEESGEFKAVASGTLPCGRPVVVNADGTVSVVAETAESLGSATTFEAAESSSIASTFDSNSNKVVIAYKDVGNSGYGTAIVGTVSGTSISFGSPTVFYNDYAIEGDRGISATFDSSNSKVVLAFQESGNGSGKAIVGTVSGTSISFGSLAAFDSSVQVSEIHITFDSSNNKAVIAYRDGNNSNYGTAIVGTVSGTSISFGTAVVFQSALTNHISTTFDSNSNKIIIAYRDNTSAGYGEVTVGTVSGTSISFGSQYIFSTQSSGGISETAVVFDSSANKIVVAWQDGTDSNKGAAVVGTVDGTAVTFGSKVFFETGSTTFIESTFNTSANKIVIAYKDTSNSNYGTYAVGTVSGTSITFETPVVFEEAYTQFTIPTYDSNAERIVISYQDVGNSQHGKSIVLRNGSTNITSENYIGMSRGVVAGEPASTGTAVSFESGTTTLSHVAFDSSNNKVVIAYVDSGDSDKGKAVVGTVSGTSISFGSIVTFEAGGTANVDCVFDNNSNKVVILFQDNGDSGKGKGIVGTVSETSISFGSPTQFNSGNDDAYNIAAAFDSSNNKVVVAYRDNGNSDYPTAAVGTVSGTSISFGTPVVVKSVYGDQETVVFDSSNNKVAVGFQTSSSTGEAAVGTVSGTGISFGSSTAFNAGDTTQLAGTFDNSNNKVVFAYRDNANSNQGTAVVGTISGTSISFGSEVIFNTGNTQGTSAVFDTNVNKVVISYEDRGDSDKGKFIVGTVSGTSISFDTETTFSGSNAVFQTGAAFDSNANKVVIAYANDTDSSDRGEAIVTNIDSLTRAEVASGGNASMDIIGSVSDNQIGLTAGQQYFVQTDGTIGTTAATPSVLAGTAISATELVVKT